MKSQKLQQGCKAVVELKGFKESDKQQVGGSPPVASRDSE